MTGGMLLSVVAACRQDARLAGKHVRDPQVETITAYGKTLDQKAGPRDVVYVLLQAIVDDYAAGNSREKRDKALDVEFGVCAPEYLRQRMNSDRLNEQEENDLLYRIVDHWAPILGLYRASFAGEFPDVAQRMHVEYPLQPTAKTEICRVYVNLDHPHPEQAGPNSGVVAVISLVREQGYWRVWSVGFDPSMRNWHKRFPDEPAAKARPAPPQAKPHTPQADDSASGSGAESDQ